MLKDIQDRADITKLVHTFYEHLLKDEDFRHIFLEVAEIDLLDHFEIIIDFWESVLFQAGKYKRDPLQKHLDIHMDHRLTDEHFKRWLAIFNTTVDELFEGATAKGAKDRALSIATIIKMKIDDLENRRLALNN
ncbi:MAG: group III truncated hemoglobin [Bacteroidota bacterium]